MHSEQSKCTYLVAAWLVWLLPKAQAEEGEGDAGEQRYEGKQCDGMQWAYRSRECFISAQVCKLHQDNTCADDIPSLSTEKKSSQKMQRVGATMTWLMAALWIPWLSLVGTYA